MARSKEIEIEIDLTTGEIKMDAIGFQGVGCSEALDKLQAALKAETLKKTVKPERVQKVAITSPNKQTLKTQ